MKFARTYSAPGAPYAGVGVRAAHVADREPRREARVRGQGHRHTDRVVPGRDRHPGPEVLPQGRRPRQDGANRRGRRPGVAVALGAGRRRKVRRRERRPAGLQPPGRLLDLLGLQARLLRHRVRGARAYYDEMCAMLARQIGAPNSPQWFNTGLHWAYGISGPAQGHYYVDPKTGVLSESTSAYEHPAPHACLPYDAKVMTPDGPVPIGSIVENDLVGLQVYDETGRGRVSRRPPYNGVKAVYRVRLSNGNVIEATGDHLVLACDEHQGKRSWREVQALKPGMRLIQRIDMPLVTVAATERRSPRRPSRRRIPVAQPSDLSARATGTSCSRDRKATRRERTDRRPDDLGDRAIGEADVYDIQTESHTFLTNNVVVHNCFIQSVTDDLVNEGGIMDLWVREARIFKYGSGTGSNFSRVRGEGEKLSGGGTSSGLMSFLKVGDRAAGAINPAARRGAQPRWCASISIIPTSKSSSRGR